MPSFIISSTVTTTSLSSAYTLGTGDSLLVTPTGTLAGLTAGGSGLTLGGDTTVVNRGTIYGDGNGILALTGVGGRRIRNAEGGGIHGENYGIIISTGADPGTGHRVENDGEVSGDFYAVYVAGDATAVRNGGTISGGTGLFVDGNGVTLTNTGGIFGRQGVNLPGENTDVFNAGTIAATGNFALRLGSSGVTLTNAGTIRAEAPGSYAVIFSGLGTASTAGNVLHNTGSILGGASGFAVYGDSRAEDVRNAGVVSGLTVLLGGNDRFDGTLGRQDRVEGGDGDDTLLGGREADLLIGVAGADSLVGGGGDDTLIGGTGADTLEGGEGRDLLDYRISGSAVEVSLALGTGSGGDAAGDVFSGFEWLAGGAFDDTLSGDAGDNRLFGAVGLDVLSGVAGNDTLVGGDDADFLIGGAGADVLTGGGGADRFRYAVASDSAGAGRDVITDFAAGDRVDLLLLDANAAGGTANDAFAFVGSAAFTAPGQVRALVIGDNTYVYANTDANLATSEMVIVLRGAVTLTAADFVL